MSTEEKHLNNIISLEKSITLLECIDIIRGSYNKEDAIYHIKEELEKLEESRRVTINDIHNI